MTISAIIPAFNEQTCIGASVENLLRYGGKLLKEIIVVDGGSTDNTCEVARASGARVVVAERKGRAFQMNTGAQLATGDILYFVHADVIVHSDYIPDILTSVNDGYAAGCYRYRFDSGKTLLKINAYFTRFPAIWCRGGDQTLFVTTKVFHQIGGYNGGMVIMEDYDIIVRIKKEHQFRIVPKDITVSARKYETNNYLRVQIANFFVFSMYFWGASQDTLVQAYSKILKYR